MANTGIHKIRGLVPYAGPEVRGHCRS